MKSYTRARVTCSDTADLDAALQRFGIADLRPHQRAAIDALLAGRDVLGVSPTGSGKTLAPWLVGWLRRELVLVVSPLRSLIADHARRLLELGIEVRKWNSDVPDAEKAETVDLLRAGWCGFLYTTPESLKSPWLFDPLRGRVGLLFVDEAHCCLRERGFRISYAWLGRRLRELGQVQVYACTATLPADDRQELIESLQLVDPLEIVAPVARSNLKIVIIERNNYALAQVLNRHHGESGIIFCSTVRTAEALHARLTSQGRDAVLYHGRLPVRDKDEAQTLFLSGQSNMAIVTDAFLLGIDKSDLRWTLHWDYPKSLEDWTQGFGRAGRDGLPANCYAAFELAEEGRRSREFLLQSSHPEVDELRAVWEFLITAPLHDATASEIGEGVLGREGRYSGPAAMTMLKRHGLADNRENPNDRRKRLYFATGDFDAVDWEPYEAERAAAFGKFRRLCEVARLPADEIVTAIDDYFQAN